MSQAAEGSSVQTVPFRLLRTVVVGSTIFGLAAGAHLLAGGTLPAAPIMGAIVALHLLCSTIATKFRLTPAVMVSLLASSQTVLHQIFSLLSHGTHDGAAGGVPGLDMAAHHGMSAPDMAALMLAHASSGMEVGAHAGPMSTSMMAAHIAATLLTAGLLAYGENALWSLANWLRPLYRCAAVVLVLPTSQAQPAILPRPLPRLPWRNLRPDTRRGPPTAAALYA